MMSMWEVQVKQRSGYVWLECPVDKCGYIVECENNTLTKLHEKARSHFASAHEPRV